jgi:hypothetical protein
MLLHCNGVSSVASKETYLPHLLILCKIHLEKKEIEICMQEICNTSTVYILYLNIINQLLPLPMLSRQEGPCALALVLLSTEDGTAAAAAAVPSMSEENSTSSILSSLSRRKTAMA